MAPGSAHVPPGCQRHISIVWQMLLRLVLRVNDRIIHDAMSLGGAAGRHRLWCLALPLVCLFTRPTAAGVLVPNDVIPSGGELPAVIAPGVTLEEDSSRLLASLSGVAEAQRCNELCVQVGVPALAPQHPSCAGRGFLAATAAGVEKVVLLATGTAHMPPARLASAARRLRLV